jgi:thioredoxin 2
MDELITCPSCGARNRVPKAHPGRPECGRCHSPLPWIVDAGESDFDSVAGAASLPVLVDLWAPWCGPCRAVSPIVERLAHAHAGSLKVVKVNVDQAPAISQRYGVMGIPTLLLLRGGKEVARQVGAPPEAALRQWLEGGLTAAA